MIKKVTLVGDRAMFPKSQKDDLPETISYITAISKRQIKTLLDAKESKAQEDADGSGSKCAVFVMNAGSVKAYHEGIYERIGEHIITNFHTRGALFGQKIFLITYSSSSHEQTAGTCLPC
jgi:hypothetical protein